MLLFANYLIYEYFFLYYLLLRFIEGIEGIVIKWGQWFRHLRPWQAKDQRQSTRRWHQRLCRGISGAWRTGSWARSRRRRWPWGRGMQLHLGLPKGRPRGWRSWSSAWGSRRLFTRLGSWRASHGGRRGGCQSARCQFFELGYSNTSFTRKALSNPLIARKVH